MPVINGIFHKSVPVYVTAECHAAIQFVGKHLDNRKLSMSATLTEFANGRAVGGCRTISEAISAYRKSHPANRA